MLNKLLRMGEGRELKLLGRITRQVNDLEADFRSMTDTELADETPALRERFQAGESLDALLPEAFALVREAARRVLGQRPFDVQIMGGAALHRGNIAEMRTGEGKTLTAVLPAYLNALTGEGVHVVTVNDYLAERDSSTMGPVYRFLGMSVGTVLANEAPEVRRLAYACDVTYGTNNEFGFDYLRDNMARDVAFRVQRGHAFAVVDEVDSILIDEARTPLIISGPTDHDQRWYQEFARLVTRLQRGVHYDADEAKRTVSIDEAGVDAVENHLGIDNLYEGGNTPLVGYLNNALKAKELFEKDRDYIIRRGEVLIVDEFTGRVLEGRRYSEGIHQAIEAKEGVRIREENQTLATITLQNYFRLYNKLSGMTGTAQTEAAEFQQTYGLGVVTVPTNEPMIRLDRTDTVYKTQDAKFDAVVDDIAQRHAAGQPVLVGTTSVAKSELVSTLLVRRGIPHEVLNAKHDDREAAVVAQAGRPGAVTVATNMAGRGTDIVLGGNLETIVTEMLAEDELDTPDRMEEVRRLAAQQLQDERDTVVAAGGLYVLGTERHESRRIDDQLRGRSGRQGDPGEARFYLSLEDDLLRLFNTNAVQQVMDRLDVSDDSPLEFKIVNRAIRGAQAQVEAKNFDARKQVLKYDEVLNEQRKVVYAERLQVLEGADIQARIKEMVADVAQQAVEEATSEGYLEDWDLDALQARLGVLYPGELDLVALAASDPNARDVVRAVREDAVAAYERREEELGSELMRALERRVVLNVIDRRWREHLYEMDYLKEGIGLRSMAQRDPLIEYQREGFTMFVAMMTDMQEEVVGFVLNTAVETPEKGELPPALVEEPAKQRLTYTAPDQGGNTSTAAQPDKDDVPVVGRNAPCPCGSGRKYKLCHGRNPSTIRA